MNKAQPIDSGMPFSISVEPGDEPHKVSHGVVDGNVKQAVITINCNAAEKGKLVKRARDNQMKLEDYLMAPHRK